ncbi:hypothetical protein E2C01_075857 [Portunus trituberculatus]|uniref:Uncharacterized protein n=1 Tax=Portunus trituberculatus TaxID=210409 RepID=A0A5B7I9S9_PORTR|nr:hypothetical protein [Portunus trituberculatus]
MKDLKTSADNTSLATVLSTTEHTSHGFQYTFLINHQTEGDLLAGQIAVGCLAGWYEATKNIQ